MPKKPTLPETNNFLVTWTTNGNPHWQECVGARVAVDVYRQMREFYGDNVRLARIIVDYGKEI